MENYSRIKGGNERLALEEIGFGRSIFRVLKYRYPRTGCSPHVWL